LRIAPVSASMSPGSIVTPGPLAFVLVNKFVNHLPFYRQEARFERIRIRICRQDMSSREIAAAENLPDSLTCTARGPVDRIVTEPDYLDVTLAPGADLYHRIPAGKNAFAYVIGGQGRFGDGDTVGNETLVFFSDGERIRLRASRAEPFRFLLCSGMGIGEPVAWQGPIVMNTKDELAQAFRELQDGSFLDPTGE